MKKEADLSGADVAPSSSTCGTDDGRGFGSTYGWSRKAAPRWVDMAEGYKKVSMTERRGKRKLA
jgi:hypothetical protein